jgi:hypothetical protein
LLCLQFDGILTITHSSNLALPGSANITTAAGDVALFLERGASAWRCIHYQRADGTFPTTGYLPLAGGTLTGALTVSGSIAVPVGSTGWVGNDAARSYLPDDGSFGGIMRNGGGWKVQTGGANDRLVVAAAGSVTINAPTTGVTATVVPVSGSAAMRFPLDAAFVEYYNTANTTRSGYLQIHATSTSRLWIEVNQAIEFGTNNTSRVTITSDGRLYGTALHNNAGAVTGTTNQYIASGTYTPSTNAGLGNVTTATANLCQWTRVGNVVTVSGSVAVDPVSASTRTIVGIALPIASNFTAQSNCAGSVGFEDASNVYSTGFCLADATNDIALLSCKNTTDTASNTWYFQFTYTVL